jgi:hypothetical protein
MIDAFEGKRLWCYCGPDNSPEDFSGSCATREEAIAEATNEFGGEPFDISEAESPDPDLYTPDVNDIIEGMRERALDNEAPECAEEWPDVSDEGKQKLEDLLAAWARKHCKPIWYICIGTAEHIVPEKKEPSDG